MRFYLLLTVTLLLTLSTGGDAGPRRANGLQKHFMLHICSRNCRPCGNSGTCCCAPNVCSGNQCRDDK
nr:TPA_inf: conotoxin precursor SF-mi2 [Conus ebraeus]